MKPRFCTRRKSTTRVLSLSGTMCRSPKSSCTGGGRQREEYRTAGRLNYFLSNYCATPEESFQHSGESAFDPELLDELRLRTRPGDAYEFDRKVA